MSDSRSPRSPWLSLGLAAVCSLGLGAQEGRAEDGVSAWIDVETGAGLVRFSAMAEASESMEIRYSLKIEKVGPSGRAVTSQGGRSELRGGDAARRLSTVSVDVGPDSSYIAELTVQCPDGSTRTAVVSSVRDGEED